jgi:hypothetical protein
MRQELELPATAWYFLPATFYGTAILEFARAPDVSHIEAQFGNMQTLDARRRVLLSDVDCAHAAIVRGLHAGRPLYLRAAI